eukprot:353822-Chlamydomonas_euryale.AAC.1
MCSCVRCASGCSPLARRPSTNANTRAGQRTSDRRRSSGSRGSSASSATMAAGSSPRVAPTKLYRDGGAGAKPSPSCARGVAACPAASRS